jgi:DNA-binding PadR family transcriptional regulator
MDITFGILDAVVDDIGSEKQIRESLGFYKIAYTRIGLEATLGKMVEDGLIRIMYRENLASTDRQRPWYAITDKGKKQWKAGMADNKNNDAFYF